MLGVTVLRRVGDVTFLLIIPSAIWIRAVHGMCAMLACGCSAKAAVLGNAQERLHTVERALPDCEVLLHALSTLSRIVVRRKRSYIWSANRRSADAEMQKPRQRPQALKEPSP